MVHTLVMAYGYEHWSTAILEPLCMSAYNLPCMLGEGTGIVAAYTVIGRPSCYYMPVSRHTPAVCFHWCAVYTNLLLL